MVVLGVYFIIRGTYNALSFLSTNYVELQAVIVSYQVNTLVLEDPKTRVTGKTFLVGIIVVAVGNLVCQWHIHTFDPI